MKKLLLVLGLFMFIGAYSQTTVLQENFDGATVQFTSSAATGTTSWALSDSYSTSGTYSDSATVAANDHLYLTSNSFNTTGNMNVLLEFEHICKIEFFDSAYIEVSNDNGATWSTVTQSMYLGANPSAYLYNKFSAGSYVIWDAATNNATPTNAWWMPEQFDISSLAANSANVKIRFVLADANINGANGAIGWFIDDVKVDMAPDELIPPVVAFNSPILANDTVYNANPILIDAMIKDDGSGIDTAYVAYTVNGVNDTVGFAPYQADTMRATVPFIGFGRTLEYHIVAIDASLNANTTVLPATGNRSIYAKFTPGIQIVALQESFENGFPGTWTQSSTDDFDWTNYSGSTTSSPTGPTSAHDGSYYMYTETSPSATWNATSIIETPSINIDTLISPVMSFYYHMMGATIGSLNIDIYDGSSWTTGVFVLTGQQQSAEADPWMEATVDLTSYKSTTTKIRFRAETGSSFTGDIAIDLVKVGDGAIPQPDAGIEEISSPTGGIIANINFDVKVRAKNWSSDTLTSYDVNWEVNGTPQTTYSSTTAVMPGMLSDTLTLGTQNLGSGSHTLKVWTANPNSNIDFNTSNDTMYFNFYGCANLLSGTYTIGGTGADYPTFADAALALNQCGINGPVTFNVASGTYTEQFDLGDISGSSATNTITFQSASGDSSAVIVEFEASGGSDNYVVRLDETKYTTFTEMTFQSLDTTYGKVFDVIGAASDLTFTNNVIQTNMPGINGSADMALIYAPGGVGDNMIIQNNLFNKGSRAITLTGATSSNWDISNNIIEGHYGTGVILTNAVSPIVKYNNIVADTTSLSDSYNGIVVANGSGTAEVAYNYIRTDATQVSYGISINNGTYDSLSPAMVYNNMISLFGNSTANTLSCGLLNYGAKNVNYYYNTSHFEGSQTNAANISIYENANNTGNINVINNIFSNNAGGYIYYISGVDTSKFTTDFNNYYEYNVTDFAYLGSAVATLADWQAETGGDQNAQNYDPYYTSASDLHVSNNYLNNIGTPIASITDDIDGDTRSTTAPDMGADEFDASSFDIASLQVLTPVSACGLTSSEVVTLQMKNLGSDTISGNLTAYYSLVGNSTIVSENVTSTIAPGDTFNYPFTQTADLSVATIGYDSTFIIDAWATLIGDPVNVNDSTFKEVNSGYVPDSISLPDDTIWYGEKDTFIVNNATNVYWWATDTSSTEILNDSVFITPNLYDTTTYWVSDRAGAGFMTATVGTGVVTNNSSGYPTPFANWYWGNKEQYLLLASELQAMGISAGPISSVAWDVVNVNACPALNNFEISIGTTTQGSLTTWISGLTNVVPNTTYTPTTGWNTFTFSTPFVWDGVSNIVVQVCSNNSSFISSGNASVNSSTTAFNSVLNYHSDASGVCANSTLSYGFPGTQRPNIQFEVEGQGCFGPRTDVTVYIDGFPSEDASINQILQPAAVSASGVNHDLEVELINYGTNDLQTLDIAYSLNGSVVDTFAWTGNLAYQDTANVVIDQVNFAGGIYDLYVYSFNPNGVSDTINTNDTAYKYIRSCMNGSYTIGDTTGGVYNDFPTFTDAVNTLLAAGVCGNVTFLADSGTYVEQIAITEVLGADSNNTVTFTSKNGDSTSVILEYSASSSADPHTVHLDGADYITFKNITIKGSGSSYARAFVVDNDANNNTITNNIIDLPASTSSYVNAVYATGQNDTLTITNNHIKNGGYSLYLMGSSSSARMRMITIEDNFIDGYGYYGMYVQYSDSARIVGNIVNEGSQANYSYAMYCYYIFDDFVIANNEINMIEGGTSTKYGLRVYYGNYYLYQNNDNGPGLVYNNMVNIRSGTGVKYGLYAYYSDDVYYYYNTIRISGGGSTVRCLYQYNTTSNTNGQTFINNSFIDSVGYQVIYAGQTSTIASMDYNNYYTAGGDISYWQGTTSTTLASHQSTSNMDANSQNINPGFMANDNLRLMSTDLSGYGLPISAVTTDIDGEARSVIATTIGADEVPLLPVDIGVIEILNVNDTTYEGYSTPVSAVVRNFGTDTVVGYQVDYTINGGTAISQSVLLDTLFVGDIDTITLANFPSPAGASNICVTTVLSTDSNAFNDGTCQNFFGVPVKDAKAISMASIDGGCGIGLDTVSFWIKNIGIDTINGPGQTAQPTVNFMNDLGVGATVTTENFNSVVNPGDSVLYTFIGQVDLTNNTQYDSVFTVTVWVDYPGDNVTYNDTLYQDVTSMHIPNLPTFTSPVSVPYGTSVTLSASSLDSIYWYATDTSSTEFNVGSNYSTGYMYSDTTFWLEARTMGGSPLLITEASGNPDFVEITNMTNSPFDATGWQVIINANDNTASQAYSPTWQLGQFLSNEVQTKGDPNWGSNIYWVAGSSIWVMLIDDQGTVRDFVASNWTATEIANMSVTAGGFTGLTVGNEWIGPGINSPDNFLVRTSYDMNDATDWINSSTGSQGQLNNMVSIGSVSGMGCSSGRDSMNIIVTGQLDIDIAALQVNSPVSQIGLGSNEQLTVTVSNFGLLDHDSIPIAYVLDNNPPVYDTVYQSVASGNSSTFTFSQPMDLSTVSQTYNVTVYTHEPLDSNQLNDTTSTSITNMPLNYCICAATSTGYEDLTGISIDTWSHTNAATGAMYTDYTSVTPTAFIFPGATHNISVTSDFPPSYSYQYGCWTNVFIDFNRDGDFDDNGELVYGASTQSSNTVSGTFSVPFNALSGNTMMRVVLREGGNQGNTGPCNTFTWGEAEDYMITVAPQIADDIGVESISNLPTITNTPTQNVDVRVRNYGTNSQSSFYLIYNHNQDIDSMLVSPTNSLLPGDSIDITLNNFTLDQGQNYLDVYTNLPGDSNLFNDDMQATSYLQVVLNAPYFDDFDDSTNYWFNDTVPNQWEWGIPNGVNFNSAHSSPNVMATKLDTHYVSTPVSGDYLYSPVLLIGNTIDSLELKFWHMVDIDGADDDRCFIQWSESGSNWQSVGVINDPNGTNWYDATIAGSHSFSSTNNNWVQSTYMVDFLTSTSPFNGVDTIQFRFVMIGDGSTSYDGWMIDDFSLALPQIAQDAHVMAINAPAASQATGSTVFPKVDVYNAGTQPLSSIDMSYDINLSGTPITETWTPSPPIAPGATVEFTFGTSYTSLNIDYSIFVEADATGDIYHYNDTMTKFINQTPADYDVMISDIVYPWDTTSLSCPPIVIIEIKNVGVNTLTSIPVEYTAYTNTVTDVWTGSLAPGDSVEFEFSQGYQSQLGNYQLCARTALTNDGNPGNDEACKSLIGVVNYCDSIVIDGIPDGSIDGFILGQNQPNPAFGKYEIEYEIPNSGQIYFEIRNSLGQIIYKEEGFRKAGVHSLKLNASDLANGVYYYSMDYNKARLTRKMVITK